MTHQRRNESRSNAVSANTDDQSLAQRVERLEQSARRWRATAATTLLALAGFVTIAATDILDPSPLVRTNRLEIIDENGNIALTLGADADGGSAFLYNAQGAQAIEFFADPDGRGHFRVNESDGGTRASVRVDNNGAVFEASGVTGDTPLASLAAGAESGHIAVRNAGGETLIELDAAQNAGRLAIKATGDRPTMLFGAGPAGGGMLAAYDDQGRPRARFGVTEHHAGAFTLLSAQGLPAVDVFAGRDHRGALRIADEYGDPKLTLQIDDDGGAFYVLNAAGQPAVELYASQTGSGTLVVSDQTASPRIRLEATNDAGVINLLSLAEGLTSATTFGTE